MGTRVAKYVTWLHRHREKALTVPNLLSSFRFFAAPALLWLAWYGYRSAFVAVLTTSLLTDALDGYIARRLNQESGLGIILDTWADVVIYIAVPISAWWLWPDVMRQEAPYVIAVVASFSLPAIIGLAKFGVITSYHTWSVKFAAACAGASTLLIFIGGPVWPFELGTPICVLAAIEQVAITMVLPKLRSNVRSLWHVLRRLQQTRRAGTATLPPGG